MISFILVNILSRLKDYFVRGHALSLRARALMMTRLIPDPVLITPTRLLRRNYLKRFFLERKLRFVFINTPGAMGLAAPQVGSGQSLFLVASPEGDKRRPLILYNPTIVEFSGDTVEDYEACLSIPGGFVSVPRSEKIVLSTEDFWGRKKTLQASGLMARIIQHENDHLNGVLIIKYGEFVKN